jgi:hypothetical protein
MSDTPKELPRPKKYKKSTKKWPKSENNFAVN